MKPSGANMDQNDCVSLLWHTGCCVFMCVCTVSDRAGALNQSAEFFPYKSMTLDMMIQTPRLHTVTCLYSRITGGHNSGPRLPFQTLHYLICFTGNTTLSFTRLSSFLPIRGWHRPSPSASAGSDKLCVGKGRKEKKKLGGKDLSFYISIFCQAGKQAGRQAGSLECQCVALQPLTDARSQWHNQRTHADFASGRRWQGAAPDR